MAVALPRQQPKLQFQALFLYRRTIIKFWMATITILVSLLLCSLPSSIHGFSFQPYQQRSVTRNFFFKCTRNNNNNHKTLFPWPTQNRLQETSTTTTTTSLSTTSSSSPQDNAATDVDEDTAVKNIDSTSNISTKNTTRTNSAYDVPPHEMPSFWKPKPPKSFWRERIELRDLKFGQKLSGHVVQELIEGTITGPKIFFECGVGRRNNRTGKWQIAHGMMRLGPRGKKISIARKRAAKFRSRDENELYVSRIQVGCGRFEVCPTLEEAESYYEEKDIVPKIPVSSLKPNEEVRGTIVKLLPYGAVVDVGANRHGLLHIQRVADLFGKYIDKEEGLAEAGLELKAKVRLMVKSLENRRLELDFTPDVKEDAEAERREEEAAAKKASEPQSQEGPAMSEEELAAWAQYAAAEEQQAAQTSKQDDENDDDDDEYDDDDDEYDDDDDDEDREIEDALGLGYY